MELNQTGIDLGYMFFTSRRDDEVLVSWTIFYFFKKKLIETVSTYRSLRIMIGAGANALVGDSRGGKRLVGDIFFSLENISSSTWQM